MSHIIGFHIQVIFHIIYYYMGKEYHYFVIIIFTIQGQFSQSITIEYLKINESPAIPSSSLGTAAYMTVHLLEVLS